MDGKTELVLEILRRSSNPKSDSWPDDEKTLYEEYATVGSLTEAVEAVRRLRAMKIIDALTKEGSDVIFTVTLRDNNIVGMWHRETVSVPDFVEKLLEIATGFASGEANRIR